MTECKHKWKQENLTTEGDRGYGYRYYSLQMCEKCGECRKVEFKFEQK